ncbi:MAG TPA: AmmeMemoRadiSam system protein B [Bryobacteraceae bacterium]|nr:AmmeMemoRadiSam system protein B [Bryobacteraceae bacterium]
MAENLPSLRNNLDFMPSTDPGRPGLVIRDPYQFSDSVLIVPTPLVPLLDCFDGDHSELDLRAEIVHITGEIQVGDIERNLFESLDGAGFLENETYRRMRKEREAEFVAAPLRPAVFAGSAYPNERGELSSLMKSRIGMARGTTSNVAIAAPHASPDGAWGSYRAAYTAFPSTGDGVHTFVVLGTSHYGAPDRFGLTRKTFATPYGDAQTERALIDELEAAAPGAIRMEDYCHAVEHSIEFQIVFLQHLYGPAIRILPILCGPFVRSIYEGGLPEDNEHVRRFFDTLANIRAREGKRLFWVLGVDMAHMGRRYGDPLTAYADRGEMAGVRERDQERIAQLAAGNILGYWDLIQNNHDDLKWCGASPFYTFLKIMPPLKGELLDYSQWQIDPYSVVSFAAMRFEEKS